MKKRIPLYELIYRLDSKEKIFIRKYITENLNASSKKSYLDFYDALVKTEKLTDQSILPKLSKNKLKNYLSEAKFYLNKLIVKALRIHYTINPSNKNGVDSFLSNIEKQKEIYIYFSKGLHKDATLLCKKYAKDWEENKNFAMLSFAYKIMHQIELITGTNHTNNNQYFELYTELHQYNIEKSKYYFLALKVETDLQRIGQIRTEEDIKTIKTHLYTDIMIKKTSFDIYYWYVKILCHFALLNWEHLFFCIEQINRALLNNNTKAEDKVSKLQLYSKLTFIAIELKNNKHYFYYKSNYLKILSKTTFLTGMHNSTHILNSKIMESLFLFKQENYGDMFKIVIPKLDVDNYIFEGTVMYHYVDLLFARGKAYFKLADYEKAYDYLNFIIEYKTKLNVKAFTICNTFFHIWLIRYLSKEYKVLTSITNRFKLFLSNQKIDFPLEKALLKFMYSSSHNHTRENISRNAERLMQTFKELSNQAIEKNLIDKLDIFTNLKSLTISN